jgi:putative ABC transport system ATP-binding protein
VRALDGIDLSVPWGRFLAIMGPSGSGKSTLMQTLAGLDDLDEGRVRIDGVEITSLSDRASTQLRRDRVGFVFQAYNLVATLSAEQNIVLPLTIARRPVDRAWLDTIVHELGLVGRLDHMPHELSGGQQQRVAIARALVTRPAVVFADEPTGNLDSASGARILQMLRASASELGQTVIMVTHDPVAASYADAVVFLVDGTIRHTLVAPSVTSVLETFSRLDAEQLGSGR